MVSIKTKWLHDEFPEYNRQKGLTGWCRGGTLVFEMFSLVLILDSMTDDHTGTSQAGRCAIPQMDVQPGTHLPEISR